MKFGTTPIKDNLIFLEDEKSFIDRSHSFKTVDKSKLDAVFQKNLDETKEELKKINS